MLLIFRSCWCRPHDRAARHRGAGAGGRVAVHAARRGGAGGTRPIWSATAAISTAWPRVPANSFTRATTARSRPARGRPSRSPPRGAASRWFPRGDPGVFAMASAAFEAIETGEAAWRALDVEVVPGISALLAASARVGAPLGHDFCAISLSDNLKPWPTVLRRLTAAAEAGFVIALYNPASRARPWQLGAAFDGAAGGAAGHRAGGVRDRNQPARGADRAVRPRNRRSGARRHAHAGAGRLGGDAADRARRWQRVALHAAQRRMTRQQPCVVPPRHRRPSRPAAARGGPPSPPRARARGRRRAWPRVAAPPAFLVTSTSMRRLASRSISASSANGPRAAIASAPGGSASIGSTLRIR